MHRWGLILQVCLLASCSTPRPAIGERQLTSRVGAARSPVLSRDGTAIAFAATADGYTNPQIWVGRADGSGPPRPLTNDASQNYDPEFSPDGRSIYFTSTREPQGLYRVPSSGGAPELAIQNAVAAKISPDGAMILYGSAGRLVQRPLAGGSATLVLPAVDNSYAPLWSPDGAHILVTTTTPEQREPEWWIAETTAGEPRKTYLGERSFPLIMQNVHRYFLYLALIFIVILSVDVWKAMWFADPAGGKTSFGIGIGTIVLAINVVLLGGYTFGCHSLRHLIGGFRDQLSRSPSCYNAYRCVSCFNRRHMLWAWMSLFWVGFSDLYVRLCSTGVWHDLRLF